MKRFILNPKNKKGIIAEIVGTNGLRIQKRKTDHYPINVFIKGDNFDVVANCTLTGEPVLIECIDGKIVEQDLLIEERQDNGEEDNKKRNDDDNSNDNQSDGSNSDNDSGTGGTGSSGSEQTGDESKGDPEKAGSGDPARRDSEIIEKQSDQEE